MDITGQYPHRGPGACVAGAIGPAGGRDPSPRGVSAPRAAAGRVPPVAARCAPGRFGL